MKITIDPKKTEACFLADRITKFITLKFLKEKVFDYADEMEGRVRDELKKKGIPNSQIDDMIVALIRAIALSETDVNVAIKEEQIPDGVLCDEDDIFAGKPTEVIE
jgi:hypothetical protein